MQFYILLSLATMNRIFFAATLPPFVVCVSFSTFGYIHVSIAMEKQHCSCVYHFSVSVGERKRRRDRSGVKVVVCDNIVELEHYRMAKPERAQGKATANERTTQQTRTKNYFETYHFQFNRFTLVSSSIFFSSFFLALL